MKNNHNNYLTLFVLVVMALISCSQKQDDVNITQLLFNESITNAYLDGKAYTGKAWSDDGRTICLNCENGQIKLVEVYHPNGQIAMRNTSLVGAGQCYDPQGNPVSIEEFVGHYPAIITHIQIMVEGMLCSSELP